MGATYGGANYCRALLGSSCTRPTRNDIVKASCTMNTFDGIGSGWLLGKSSRRKTIIIGARIIIS